MSYPLPPGLKQGQKIDDWLKSVHYWLEECHRIMADAPVNAELEKVKFQLDCTTADRVALIFERDQAMSDCKVMAEALDKIYHEALNGDGTTTECEMAGLAEEVLTPERRERYLK